MLNSQRLNLHFPMVFPWFSYGNPPFVFFLQTLEFNPPVKRGPVGGVGAGRTDGTWRWRWGCILLNKRAKNTPYVFHVIYPSVFI